ncbi:hypothetical protein V6D40_07115 [Corynebacterium sp. Q4381]|uniref:hypothetical protein n=1 Tax=Corynebacterium sp. Marseille-Q4381 TaxID=3121597 RepID=UPI002FE52172
MSEEGEIKPGRKPAPEVNDTEDEPIGQIRPNREIRIVRSTPPKGAKATLTKARASEPKPRNWREQLDWTRHKFAQRLVVGALIAIFAMAIMQYWWPKEEQSFTSTINIFQIVATTALGYVIGRSEGPPTPKD